MRRVTGRQRQQKSTHQSLTPQGCHMGIQLDQIGRKPTKSKFILVRTSTINWSDIVQSFPNLWQSGSGLAGSGTPVSVLLGYVRHGCQIWAQMRQIRDFFRSDFRTFWLGEPKCSEIWSEKVPDLSHLRPNWPNLRPNLSTPLHPPRGVRRGVEVFRVPHLGVISYTTSLTSKTSKQG